MNGWVVLLFGKTLVLVDVNLFEGRKSVVCHGPWHLSAGATK